MWQPVYASQHPANARAAVGIARKQDSRIYSALYAEQLEVEELIPYFLKNSRHYSMSSERWGTCTVRSLIRGQPCGLAKPAHTSAQSQPSNTPSDLYASSARKSAPSGFTCGPVRNATLCCDSSPNHHATGHARASGHPVIASAERGERWLYCYPDEVFAEY
jgi:hypothetical protein